MRIMIIIIFVYALALPVNVFAHIVNENTIYDDIQYSNAKEQIVLLRGLNVIGNESGVNIFKPQDTLTRKELAYWSASFHHIGSDQSSKEDLQEAAFSKGLVHSLEGNATYGDVNRAFFHGGADVPNVNDEMTKEEFAFFMGQYFSKKVNGQTLFDMAGIKPGPSGVIEKVEVSTQGEGQEAKESYLLIMNGKTYTVGSHLKVLRGPIHLEDWEGKKLEQSWMTTDEGKAVLQMLMAEKNQFTHNEIVMKEAHGRKQGFPVFPVVIVVLLAGLLGWLSISRQSKLHKK